MLDFTKPQIPERQMRCRSRARIAKRCARLMRVCLAGLIGLAFVAEPSMVSAARSGMSAMLSDLQGATRTVAARTAPFASAVQVLERPLDGIDTVAQADTDLIRP